MKFSILKSLIPIVEEKMEYYNNRFAKKKFGTLTVKYSEPYMEKKDHRKIQLVDVEVDGKYKIPGWEFIASLEWVPEANSNIIKKVDSDIEVPREYLTSTKCDHCHSDRMRKYTIILYNEETKEFKQVGRSCVKDYIGADVEDYLSYLSIFDRMSDWFNSLPKESRNYQDNFFKVDEILEQTVEEVNHYGYVSQATIQKWNESHQYDEEYCPLEKTSSQVFKIMNEVTGYGTNELARPKYEVTLETIAKVKEVKDFISNLEDKNDYIHNIKTLLQTEYVDNKNLGLVVSAVGYYLRETELKNIQKEESNSEYIGNIGDKIEFTSDTTVISSYYTEYGITYIYKFIFNGNVIIWRTNKKLDGTLTIKGTVKEHSEYNGIKQTVITRGKVI